MSLDAAREARAADIFADALTVPLPDRPRFLRDQCGADAALRARVESLLSAHADGARFFRDAECLQEALESVATPADREVGQRVGVYTITHVLAEGGMGRVYLGRRSDADFEQTVAIKLIHAGLDTSSILKRFRVERQLLARLTFPGIARLVDGGSTEDGRPYLVMEYVEGMHIDRYCDTHGLALRERLQLFLSVCDAVQYAHRNLVIHRDLKPSNILVDTHGQPKLLDFGIAKVLDSEHSDKEVATATALGLMTPRYASPEQMRGEVVNTATDIYSLGVILYELLTGRSPYEHSTGTFLEVLRSVCEQDPPAPSTIVLRAADSGQNGGKVEPDTTWSRRLPPRKHAQLLAGDLDTIVLKALHKEPDRRYGSVEEMAEDVRRYLAGLTVSARPDTARYRLSRFARRNKVLVGSVAAMIAVLVLGLATSTILYERAQRARALEAALRARAQRDGYRSNLLAAESSIRTHQLREARQQLLAAPENLRGWEWRHLVSRLDHSQISIAAHEAALTAVCWSADGDRVFSSSEDRTVRIWDAHTGAARGRLGPFERIPRTLAVSSDGNYAAIGFERGSVRVYSIAARESLILDVQDPHPLVLPDTLPEEDSQIATLNRPSPWAFVDFESRGSRLVTGFYSGSVLVHDVHTRRQIGAWSKQDVRNRTTVRWSPDGERLAIGSQEGPVHILNASTWRVVHQLHEPDEQVDLCFSRDGKKLGVAYHDGGRITVWDAQSGAVIVTLHAPGGSLRAVAFDAHAERLVSAATGGGLTVWDLSSGRATATLLGHTADVQCLASSADGTRIVSGDWDGTLKLWSWDAQDVQISSLVGRFRRNWADALTMAADGTRFLTNMIGMDLLEWDLRSPLQLSAHTFADFGSNYRAFRLVWTRDGRHVVLRRLNGLLQIVDFETGKVDHGIPLAMSGMYALDLHPSQPWFAVGCADSVQIRELESGRLIQAFVGHAPEVSVARFSRDGRWLATGAADGTVRLWDVGKGECLRVLHGHTARVSGIALSPDAAWIVSTSWDGTVRMWQTAEAGGDRVLYEGSQRMYTVDATHDGARIAAAGFDGIIRLFDPAAGCEVAQLHGHEGRVFALAFTPDDTKLISTSLDGTIRIWEAPPAVATPLP